MKPSQKSLRVLLMLQSYTGIASILSASVGLIVLSGWILNIPVLKSVLPASATMKFNTALSFVLAGLSLWLLRDEKPKPEKKRVGQIFASFVIVIASVTLSEYLFDYNLGIDELFIHDAGTAPSAFPGRMSEITAICFMLSGLGILLIGSKSSQYPTIGVTSLSLLALIGYLFGYQALYRLAGFGSVALLTAFIFLLLSLGILAARPTLGMVSLVASNLSGGRTVRFLLPVTIIIAVALGMLVEQGENLDLFDSSSESIILVVLLIFIYSPLVYWFANRINQTEEQITRLNRLYVTLSQVNQAIVRVKSRQELFEAICKIAVEFGQFRMVWIGLIDNVNGDVIPQIHYGHEDGYLDSIEINVLDPILGKGPSGSAFHTDKVTLFGKIESDPRMIPWRSKALARGYRSAASVPFHFEGKVIGILNLFASEEGFFTEGDRKLLEEIGLDISFALDNIQAREEIEFQARLLENVYDPVIATNVRQVITYWNHAAEEVYGWRRDEVLGKLARDVIGSEITETQRAEIIKVLEETGRYRIEVRQHNRSGDSYWVEGNTIALRDEKDILIGFVSINRNITERKRAEEKIQRHMNYVNALREIDRAITSSFDLQVSLNTLISRTIQILEVDAALVLLLNPVTSTLEFAAGSGFWSESVRTASIRLGESYAGRVAVERQIVQIPDLARETRNLFQTGFLDNERFAGYYGAPLIVKGKVIGALEVFHRSVVTHDKEWLDIFDALAGQAAIAIDQARMFENLQRTNVQLEHRVAERTMELNQKNLELERANRAKDEFLAIMSHELRTPLNSILGLSETLLEQRRHPLNEHQQKSLQVIETSGRHLLELINDVLDLSKIEAGKFDYYPQAIEVKALCQSSMSFVRQQAMRKSIDLRYEEENTIDRIHADPRRLKQILVNLMTNAVKFTPEHGEVTLTVRSDIENDQVQFSVQDTGIGIAQEDLKKLFQPFSQVDSSLTREFEGTGLGLALAQRLTDLHGGSVQVESEPGKGSTFTVNIPWGRNLIEKLEASDTGKVVSINEPGVITESNYSILLAEDNMANTLTIGEYLESHGFTVVNAKDGLEAIELVEKLNPNLILMDIQMPVLDGLESIRRLRQDQRFASTPIIALTALAMPGDREQCIEAGANEYMSKPVSLKSLVKTIHRLLGNPHD